MAWAIPSPCKRVDQPGRIAHQQHPAGGRRGPHHAHFEPPAEAGRQPRRRRPARAARRRAGGRRTSGSARTAFAPAWRSAPVAMPSPMFAPPSGAGEHPPVAGEGAPRRRFPHDDGGEVHRLGQVGAHGEAPQDLSASTSPAAAATPLVAPSAPITKSARISSPVSQPVARRSGPPPPTVRPPAPGRWYRPGLDGRVVQHGVEHSPGDRRPVPGVGEPLGARHPHPAPRRPDDQHVAHVGPVRAVGDPGRPAAGGPGDRPCHHMPCRAERSPGPPGPPAPHRGPGRARPRCPPGRSRPRGRRRVSGSRCSFLAVWAYSEIFPPPEGVTLPQVVDDRNRFAQNLFTAPPPALRPPGRGSLHGPERAVASGHGRSDRAVDARSGARCGVGNRRCGAPARRRARRPTSSASTSPWACSAQGRRNVARAGLNGRVQLVAGRAEQLPFPDRTFDALTFTYLLRYVDDPQATLQELARVVKPGGAVASLEFYLPPSRFWRAWWWLYTRLRPPGRRMADRRVRVVPGRPLPRPEHFGALREVSLWRGPRTPGAGPASRTSGRAS